MLIKCSCIIILSTIEFIKYLTTGEEREHSLIVYRVIWYIYKHNFSLEALFSSIWGRKIISGVRLFKASHSFITSGPNTLNGKKTPESL